MGAGTLTALNFPKTGAILRFCLLICVSFCAVLFPLGVHAGPTPAITTQPQSQTNLLGTNVTFSVAANGQTPLYYLWYFNGTNLVNSAHIGGTATNALTITNITGGDAGNYQVIVSNLHGTVTSSNAQLTILFPAAITGQPLSQTVYFGGSASFSVSAAGTAPLKYQWYFNGSPLSDNSQVSGSATAALTITPVFSGYLGNYRVVVTNNYGAATSMVAVLNATNRVFFVNINNPNPVPPYTNWNSAATNIQDAVDWTVNGDSILVTNGVYSFGNRVTSVTTNCVVITNSISISSVSGPAQTVINGGGNKRCVNFSVAATLSGFTLTNGATSENGAGVYCAGASTVISNCIFAGNGSGFGGGAYQGTLVNCTLVANSANVGAAAFQSTLSNCVVANNTTDGGAIASCTASSCLISNNFSAAGLQVYGAGAIFSTLNNCTVAGNQASANAGGGYYCTFSNCLLVANSSGLHGGGVQGSTLYNCVLSNNVAGGWGGGAWQSTLYNCLLAGNNAQEVGGGAENSTLVNCTVVNNSASSVCGGVDGCTLTNSIVYFNNNGNYTSYLYTNYMSWCCTTPLPDPTAGVNNLASSPLLTDITNGNYHLYPGSPCIDAGYSAVAPGATDLDGNQRIVNGTVDLGAYEFQNTPFIETQPVSQTVILGTSSISFSVVAVGPGTLTYQWMFNGTNIAGATNSTFTLYNPQYSQAGNYSVAVMNSYGSTISATAVFKVAYFSLAAANFPGLSGGVVRWVDFDNDGRLDLYVSGTDSNFTAHTHLYHNNGDGTFTEIPTPLTNWVTSSAEWVDFDGDGYLDLVAKVTPDPSLDFAWTYIFKNNGGTNLTQVASLPTPYTDETVVWADVDNDGRPDILQITINYTWVYHNNGDGTFSFVSLFPAAASGAVADYDGDGWIDIMEPGYNFGAGLGSRLYHNTGTNGFADSGLNFALLQGGFAAWSDVNNDGRPDVLLTGATDTTPEYMLTRLYRNDGGSFTVIATNLPALRNSIAAWGDFDNDGRSDLFLTGYSSSSGYLGKIFRNNGNETFSDLGLTLPGLNNGSAQWGDYDNDGKLDLVIAGNPGGGMPATMLYHNDGAAPDTPPTAPGGLSVTLGHNSAWLTWTAATDAEQTGGLSYNVRIGTATNGINIVSPMADLNTGFRRVPQIGNASYRLNFLITNLPAGTYYWSVQAIDNAYKGSLFAPEQSFTLPAPAITNQPQSLTLLAGMQAAFTVGVTGAPPIFFQWTYNGTNIVGATNSTLVLNNVQNSNDGTYAVMASNAYGSITSSNVTLTVNTPPYIQAQPQSVTTLESTAAGFSATVTGDAPLNYQWFFNGSPVPGATNATIGWSAVTPSLAGNYYLQITNQWGTTNSAVAALNIPLSAPVIVMQPQSQFAPPGIGVSATFSVSVVGTSPYFYQWMLSGTNIPGATGISLTITNVQTTDAGAYSVLITNVIGPTLSQNAVLSVTPAATSTTNFIPVSGATDFVYDDLRDILYIVTGGSGVQRYQLGSASFLTPFSVNGSLANLDLSPDGSLLAIADHTTGTNAWLDLVALNTGSAQQLILTNFAGYVYSLAFGNDGAVVSEVGNLVLRCDPVTGITTQRNSVSTSSGPMTASGDRSTIAIAGPGDSAGLVFTYNVAAQGIDGFIWSNDYITAPPEVSQDGGLLAEPTRYGLPVFINSHMSDYSGNYIAVIGSPSGAVFSPNQNLLFSGLSGTRELDAYTTVGSNGPAITASFALDFGAPVTSSRMRTSRDGSKIFGAVSGGINWITWTNLAPEFKIQPINQTGISGGNITFVSQVFGSPVMQYQWQLDGISVPGATNATLTLSNLPYPIAASSYSVIAYNPFGSIISTGGVLTVVSPPFVTSPPLSQTNSAGSSTSFAVSVGGTGPFGYQWWFNGAPITGAINTNFNLADVQATNAGGYSVVITNIYGRTTSSVATLTVVPVAPSFVLQPVSQSALVGSTATFSGIAQGTEPISYQWYFNGTNLPGAISTNLSLAGVQPPNDGTYALLASNSIGTNFSFTASLVVTAVPPSFRSQPIGCSVPPGLPATFSVAAMGTAPLYYQWQLNGTNLPGATNNSFSIAAVGTNDLGTYHVVVTNWGASVVSTDVRLTFGNVAAWGSNKSGESQPPPDLTNAFTLAGSFGASLAARIDGSMVSWGSGPGTNIGVSATNVIGIGSAAGTVVLHSDGTITGWNFGTVASFPVPPATNIISVAAGYSFGFALRAEGTLVGWGGSGPVTNVPAGLNHVTAIACGTSHALALRDDGTVAAWGSGVATNVPFNLAGVVGIAGGFSHSLALKTNGTVVAWGSGAGTNLPAGLTNVAAIFCGSYPQGQAVSLAIRSNGTVVAWGDDPNGETNPPAALNNLVSVNGAGAAYHAMTVIGDGRPLIIQPPAGLTTYVGRNVTLHAAAAGASPLSYQWLFNGTNLPGATNVNLVISNAQLSNSGNYQLVVSNSLSVATSLPAPVTAISDPIITFLTQPAGGSNYYQGGNVSLTSTVLGNGPLRYQWYFSATNTGYVPVSGATNDNLMLQPALITQSGNYYVAISNQFGGVTSPPANVRILFARAWGFMAISNPPVNVTNAIAIATGNYLDYYGDYFVVGSDGKVAGWANYSTPYGETNVSVLTNFFVAAIAAGYQDTLALKSDGTVYAWGYNGYGETNPPAGLNSVIAIACGDYHDLALKSNGMVVGWGNNANGQVTVPPWVTNVIAIAAGSQHSLALRADGTVVGWGYNNAGQVNIPPSATNVIAIAAGQYHSLALRADGTVVGWGNNGNGQVSIPAGLSNIVSISASGSHSTFLRSDGTVMSLGYEYIGPASNNLPPDLANVVAICSASSHDFGLLGTRAPAFTVQPWNHNVSQGANVLLVGKVSGMQPVTYQWLFNGSSLSGATSDNLVLTNLQLSQAGIYQLIASNSYGVSASKLAYVPAPPMITAQPSPAGLTVNWGTNVTYSVGVNGGFLAYQWLQNGTNLPNGSNSVLVLNNVARAQNGTYFVSISSPNGGVTSSNVTLKVLVPQLLGTPVFSASGSLSFSSTDASGASLSPSDFANLQAQVSTNLVNWATLPNALSLSNGVVHLSDPGATNSAGRFYRIVEN